MSMEARETFEPGARWELVPEHLREGLRRYVDERCRPGGFLVAALSNDLTSAVMRADTASLVGLHGLMLFLWDYAPGPCWGTPAKVDAWCHTIEPARLMAAGL